MNTHTWVPVRIPIDTCNDGTLQLENGYHQLYDTTFSYRNHPSAEMPDMNAPRSGYPIYPIEHHVNSFDYSNNVPVHISNKMEVDQYASEDAILNPLDEYNVTPVYRLISSTKKFALVMKNCIIRFINETEFEINLLEFKKIFKSGLKLVNNYGLLLSPSNDKSSNTKVCFYRWVDAKTGISLLNRTSWNRWMLENPNYPEENDTQYNPNDDAITVELNNRQNKAVGKPDTKLSIVPVKKEICKVPEADRRARLPDFIDRRLC
eukprot:TRINITY_DN11950_c0_g1_i1.p1 TRINITY_DN11950_c0_g1~~TRINITY_DN11950_c0_g1_i1.p1  ORF type:complete len:279 (-),score=43.49 TRINITY_DN11950_c0_g1_i1:51-839(-)